MTPTPAAVPGTADVGAASAPERRAAAGTWPRWEPPISVAAVVAVVVVLAIGAWLGLRGEWTPILDIAALEIRTAAIPESWPLVGVFSRFGWYHPGPLFILQGWLPYQLWGPAGLTVAIVAVHLAALVTAWWVARRIDRVAGGFVLLAAVVVLTTRAPEQALEPWNPFAGLVSTVTLLVLAWASALRLPVGPIIMLPLGSYLLQSHLGYVPLVGLVVLVAAALALFPGRDRGRDVPWLGWAIGTALAALLWLPVAVQQLTRTPGNLTAIVSTLGDGGQPLGAAAGWATVSSAFALRPYWTDGLVVELPESAALPWWLMLAVAALMWSAARRDWLPVRLLVVGAAAIVAAFVAVTTATGAPVEYLVSWIPAVAATTIAMSVWAITRRIAALRPAPRQARVSAAVSVVCVLLAGLAAWHWAGASQQYPGRGDASAALGAALLADAGATPFNLGADTGTASPANAMDIRSVFYGVLAAAVRGGADVGVPVPIAWEVAGVLPTDEQPRPTYVLRNFDPARSDGARVVATWVPLSNDELAELGVIDAALSANPTAEQEEALTTRRAKLLQGRVAMELVVPAGGMVGQS